MFESVFIDDINVGERRREDFGDIEGLAESIGKYGLFHPIIVDGANNLVAGERRLRACRDILKWSEMPARLYSELSEDERREIELEENLRRKDLTPYERSKNIVSLAGLAARQAADVRNWPETELRAESAQNSKSAGRPKEPTSKRSVADKIGIPEATIRDAEKHVEAVTRYPELSVAPTQKGAIDAAKKLDRLPEPERRNVLSKLATEGKSALKDIATGKQSSNHTPKPKSPSGPYAKNLSQIQVFVTTIQSLGAEDLTANWTEREAHEFLLNLRECRDGLSAIVSDLEAVEDERKRGAA